MGLVTLGLILVLRRKAPRVPGALIAVTAATALSALFDLDEHGIAVVGEIPPGLPRLAWPDVAGGDLGRLLPVALGISLVGYTDNILTSRSIASRLRYRVDANQELAALGAINVTAGLAQGFPISSSASRTAVPASLGSHTQLVGVVGAAFLAASLLLLRPLLAEIPQPALAAVIVAAAIAIIDLAGFAGLARFSRSELLLAIAAALGVMIFDVLTGVLIAVALSVVVALGKLARPHDAVLGQGVGLDGWVDAEAYEGSTTLEGLLVYRFDAPLFFANVGWFRQRLRRAMDRNPGAERGSSSTSRASGPSTQRPSKGCVSSSTSCTRKASSSAPHGPTTSSSANWARWRPRADRRRERPRHDQPSRRRISRGGPAELNRWRAGGDVARLAGRSTRAARTSLTYWTFCEAAAPGSRRPLARRRDRRRTALRGRGGTPPQHGGWQPIELPDE